MLTCDGNENCKKKKKTTATTRTNNKTTTTIGLIRELSFSQGKKAGNADRTPMFTKAEILKKKTIHTIKTMGNLETEMAAKLWWKQLLPNVF